MECVSILWMDWVHVNKVGEFDVSSPTPYYRSLVLLHTVLTAGVTVPALSFCNCSPIRGLVVEGGDRMCGSQLYMWCLVESALCDHLHVGLYVATPVWPWKTRLHRIRADIIMLIRRTMPDWRTMPIVIPCVCGGIMCSRLIIGAIHEPSSRRLVREQSAAHVAGYCRYADVMLRPAIRWSRPL